ncbi:MAG: 50S ribosomal protein L10 [Candidatus Woesearchaeota archaeon]|jgi:large subunit ribosomal protein L10|nr:50S ribosomal protein L10 [Candidatus Woesearchaeota archaeon]MDP7181644.1 50S ribosomal protein L10 [Candidatus Woesearchaeota archaeon]MDP7198733.1 50S ribosomal protein L10 [Candidatus Woesearchaeota archaeon]MDP7467267.1 50S ribosomal protein L10 [Candidatus Woesearchaeota archaeon]MDP7647398.1 50S ribosomal protein L10 [Candidatus Woesearchaeota archaeon]
MSEKPKARVSESKKKRVKELIEILKANTAIGIADLESLPAGAMAKIKKNLRGKAKIIVSKKPLIEIAIKEAGIDKLDQLLEHKTVMPAFVVGKEDPFKIYAAIKKGKTKAPAKEGQVAPTDIVVPAGPTSFTPGPIISELAQLKIKAGVEEGKIAIKEDAHVIKEGETFSPELAGMLSRLGIQPMEIGLNVKAMYEKGMIYAKDVLGIDEDQLIADITLAAQQSMNLAIEAGVVNSTTSVMLIEKAARQANALQSVVDEAKPEEKKEEAKTEEAKPEEKAAEKPEEKAEPEKKEEPAKAEKTDQTKDQGGK